MAKIKVAVDTGHGSNTAGKRHPDGYREHWTNVIVAYWLRKALIRNGFSVYKSAWNDKDYTDDSDIVLSKRQSGIKKAKCDISVSIHCNACGDGKSYNSGQGVETLIHSTKSYVGDSLKLANCVQAQLIKGTKQTNRGVKTAQLALCNCYKNGTKASILVELGFMTNKKEADLLKTTKFRKESAEEICKGICNYYNVPYVK